ncbi:hypothetical protein ON010_g13640 [Phytophthora cinnamomi]|nr:hypothetical protein ON010_g13640 [Phytophthora cinnamomi]
MHISQLQNDDGGYADWVIEGSDEEEDRGASPLSAKAEETVAATSDGKTARGITGPPKTERKLTGNEYMNRIIRESGRHVIRE